MFNWLFLTALTDWSTSKDKHKTNGWLSFLQITPKNLITTSCKLLKFNTLWSVVIQAYRRRTRLISKKVLVAFQWLSPGLFIYFAKTPTIKLISGLAMFVRCNRDQTCLRYGTFFIACLLLKLWARWFAHNCSTLELCSRWFALLVW